MMHSRSLVSALFCWSCIVACDRNDTRAEGIFRPRGVVPLSPKLSPARPADDPLASWHDTPSKKAIISFVKAVTTEGSPDYVEHAKRVAVFDDDGTLWVEQPMYAQAVFAIDRVKALASDFPDWRRRQPFKAIVGRDGAAVEPMEEQQASELLAATHAGMTTEEFASVAARWFETAHHPRFGRKYTECVYEPMLELVEYLRSRGFASYVVSGGRADFTRVVSDEVFSIPPERVVGSSGKLRFELVGDGAMLVLLPQPVTHGNNEGKPVNIQLHIGKRPILAFGNSDADQQMLEYTSGSARSLLLLLHHDDAAREFAYDRGSKIGKLDKALDEAKKRGWTVVSMKTDWKSVLPSKFEPKVGLRSTRRPQ